MKISNVFQDNYYHAMILKFERVVSYQTWNICKNNTIASKNCNSTSAFFFRIWGTIQGNKTAWGMAIKCWHNAGNVRLPWAMSPLVKCGNIARDIQVWAGIMTFVHISTVIPTKFKNEDIEKQLIVTKRFSRAMRMI